MYVYCCEWRLVSGFCDKKSSQSDSSGFRSEFYCFSHFRVTISPIALWGCPRVSWMPLLACSLHMLDLKDSSLFLLAFLTGSCIYVLDLRQQTCTSRMLSFIRAVAGGLEVYDDTASAKGQCQVIFKGLLLWWTIARESLRRTYTPTELRLCCLQCWIGIFR